MRDGKCQTTVVVYVSVKAMVAGADVILERREAEERSCNDCSWYSKRRLQSSDNVIFNFLAK